MRDEAACSRRVEQTSRDDSSAEAALNCKAVEDRLQRRPAADDQIRGRSVLPRLVIRHAEDVQIRPVFDEIDRASQNETAADDHRIRQAAGIASFVAQAEAELEVLRLPRLVVGELLHPDAQVAPQLVDLVAPDAFDRRRELLGVLRGDAVDDAIERSSRPRKPLARHGQLVAPLHRAVELRLRFVKQAAARQRIHAHERLRLVPWLETMDGRQQKLVRTRREPLQRRQRIRPAAQPMRGERRLGPRGDLDQAVARRPRGPPTRPAADHRPAQRLVQAEQVVRMPPDGRRRARVEQRSEDREIVLEIVDGPIGIFRRRPRETRAAFRRGFRCQHSVIGDAAGDRTHHVERVERRHARPCLGDVQPWIRQVQALARRANRDLQQQALRASAIVLLNQERARKR